MSVSKPEVVVITGASAGIGRATVRAFAKRGAYIGLVARSHDGLEGARQEVEAAGGKALVLPTDVSDPEQVEAAAAAVEKEFGPIDIWVNDAIALGAYLNHQAQPQRYGHQKHEDDRITESDIRTEVARKLHQGINHSSKLDKWNLLTGLTRFAWKALTAESKNNQKATQN